MSGPQRSAPNVDARINGSRRGTQISSKVDTVNWSIWSSISVTHGSPSLTAGLISVTKGYGLNYEARFNGIKPMACDEFFHDIWPDWLR